MPPNNSVVKETFIVGGLTFLGYLAGGKLGSILGAVIGTVVTSFFNEEPTHFTQEYPTPRPRSYEDEYDNVAAVRSNSRITTIKKRKAKITTKDASLKPSTCAICLEEFKPSIVLLPCGHMCFCEDCLYDVRQKRVSDCPLCREAIEEFKDVFSS
ncbi:RNA-binding protein MEX3B-like [Adelges cooleyi]|uniref:RNA-binding protein MEX3B-like n=1 Tax=Adelges cooleyi TaxID=133065 RepID=UPI0021805CF8|nr:RNA-binding protein MEX3B-like [Adelges cooleyi]XP_050443451.1 RNA-binding protein MEX3B-like [Adelges cooleyi]